jgi:AcrR family transcriptional regulator
MRKTDPRVIRTRQMLRTALVALILEKGYDAITVQDITDKAGLRRATFYLHYKDKEELLLSTLVEVFDSLVMQFEPLDLPMMSPECEKAVHLIIFRHAEEHADLYRSIFGGSGSMTIVRYVREYLARKIRENLEAIPEGELPLPVDVVANYLATVKLNMAIWWLETGMPYSVEQMAEMCTALTLNGLPEMFSEGFKSL